MLIEMASLNKSHGVPRKQEELHELLENATNAKNLWDALHSSQQLAAKEAETTGKATKGKKWKSKPRRK